MIKEITVSDPITVEGQPDGGATPMIDPYNGCQIRCPYCFQLDDKQWNKSIYVHMNIADLLKERLEHWDKSETIYLGSRCDPYMQIEERYGLTRKCLSILNELKINTMIVTKSDNDLIFRDLDIFTDYSAELTVLMGLVNVGQIGKGVLNSNILTANRLSDSGVAVWAFITPVLPYVMDVGAIIEALNENIPVYLDKLRIQSPIHVKNMEEFIKRQYPGYAELYHAVLHENDERYFDELIGRYADNSRVKILF
ncbi:MAG: hypothetical protein FWG31_10175 [Oscillospiraceae bacterium]|nr:hypothetical protein [Oscillospiraceae bacterium]